MKKIILLMVLLLAGCAAPAVPAQTGTPVPSTPTLVPTPRPLPALGAGFRYSTYGTQEDHGPAYWASVGERMAAKFPGSRPQTIWIVGNIYDQGTYLNFPCETDDPNIKCGYVDMNEAALTLFDEKGVDVWLQVEAGNADIEEVIRIVLNQYKHHPCVLGFGMDVEWYKTTDGPLGVPISDEEAERWVKAVRAIDPNYRIFLKHWEIDWMPPTYREGILFVNDHQQFESQDAMIENFTAWGKHFAPHPVGYQYGYYADRVWWKNLQDPPGDIGRAILAQNPNTAALYWVDFTVLEVFPPLE
jgi:hypothetical protein